MGDPGHPLFETVREDVSERVSDDLRRGQYFTTCTPNCPIDSSVRCFHQGRTGNCIHQRCSLLKRQSMGNSR